MLDRFKHIWNSNQTLDTKQIKRQGLQSLRDEYDLKIEAKIQSDEDVKAFSELIQDKERSVLELLNALDTLYTAKNTLISSKRETFIEEEPFEHAKEFDEEFNRRPGQYGYTGTSGYTGPVGPPFGGYNNNPFVGNSNLSTNLNSQNLLNKITITGTKKQK